MFQLGLRLTLDSIMADAAFQKTNLDWQIQQFRRQVSEWLEVQFQQADFETPNFTVAPEVWEVLFWLLISGLVLWASWQVYQLLAPYLAEWTADQRFGQPQSRPVGDRNLTIADWLKRAQTFQRQRNYGQACRALYMAMLQRLDETQTIPNAADRTDREYLQCFHVLANPRPYEYLVRTHERFCFGDAPLSEEDFRQCYSAYQETEVK